MNLEEQNRILQEQVDRLTKENEALHDDSYKTGFEHGLNAGPEVIEAQALEISRLRKLLGKVKRYLAVTSLTGEGSLSWEIDLILNPKQEDNGKEMV